VRSRSSAADGGLAFGVGLERPGDERCTFGINLDGAYLAAMLVPSANVQVADGGAPWSAALGDFLREPLGDLGGEVAAVELRNEDMMPWTSIPEGVWSMDSVAETRVTPALMRAS
jgi:hypothetical protein